MRRQCFTLLEILIVIAIISMMAAVIGININNAVREQRFRSEVDLIVDKLRLAQDLMAIFHANVSVVFTNTKENDGYILKLVPEVELPTPWLKEVQKENKLVHIFVINYSRLTEEQDELKLNFRSGGSEMPDGTLRISTGDVDQPGVKTRYIHFPGYPAPISSVDSRTPPQKDEEMNRELTQRTIEVIRAIQSSSP